MDRWRKNPARHAEPSAGDNRWKLPSWLRWTGVLVALALIWHLADPLRSSRDLPHSAEPTARPAGMAGEPRTDQASGSRSTSLAAEASRGGGPRTNPGGWVRIGGNTGAAGSGTPIESAKPRPETGRADADSPRSRTSGAASNRPSTDPREPPSLAGRVLDGEGSPLVGIEVRARGERLIGPAASPAVPAEGSAFTGANGAFAFTGLAEGQYRLAAEAAGFQRAEITVATGSLDADLVLHWERKVTVYGRLTNRWGEPLASARVTPNLSPAISVPTDQGGGYQVTASLREDVAGFDIRFEHERHAPQTHRLDEASWGTGGAVELNVALAPISQTTTLTGQMRSTTGEAVAGETVMLYSPSLMRRFEAVSGGDGGFRIQEVAMAPDYLVSVRPRGPYEDFTRREVRVIAPTELLIPLQPMESGDILGRMTDVSGNPIPNLTLMLSSTAAASRTLPVTGNERGEFAVADVPFGELVFQTYGLPFFRVSTALRGPETEVVPLVLDWGPYEVRGRVVDETGLAFAVPEVYLTWSHTQGGVRSTAMRRTAADADGFFRFTRLGPGLHRVTVNVPGYRPGLLDFNVGSRAGEVVVRLQPEGL